MADYAVADFETNYNKKVNRGQAAVEKQYGNVDVLIDNYTS